MIDFKKEEFAVSYMHVEAKEVTKFVQLFLIVAACFSIMSITSVTGVMDLVLPGELDVLSWYVECVP
jgi:hypothetical protein